MKKVFVLSAALLAQVFALPEVLRRNFRSNFGSRRFIILEEADLDNTVLEEISFRGDLDKVGRQGTAYSFVVPSDVTVELAEAGIEFVDRTEDFVANSIALDSKICDPDAGEDCFSDFHATYQTSATIFDKFAHMADHHSDIASWKLIGQTYEGRDINAFEIGHGDGKQVVFYTCAVHAREWITPMFCVYMAEQLLHTEEGAAHLEKYAFSIIPVVNVDGYDYSQTTDNAWRKTRVPNSSRRCPGTDANRNFGQCHGGPGASANECSDTYHGKAPFDNPCTRAVKDYAETLDIIHYGDVHSYGEYLLAPQSYTNVLPIPDHAAKHKVCYDAFKSNVDAVNNQNFKVGPSASVLYTASGVTGDWFYGDQKVLHSYIYEARDGGRGGIAGFQPPVENIKLSNDELWVGMSTLVNCIFDSEAENPTPKQPWTELDPNTRCGARSVEPDRGNGSGNGNDGSQDGGNEDINIRVEVESTSSPVTVFLVGVMAMVAGAGGMYVYNKKSE